MGDVAVTNEEVEARAIRVGPGRFRTFAAWITGILALMLLAPVLTLATKAPLLLAVFLGCVAVPLWTLVDRSTLTGGTIKLTSRGLRMPAPVLGTRTIARDAVESAYERDGGVVLNLKNGATAELDLVDRKSNRILQHLGLTLDQAALTAPLRGMLGGFTRGLLTVFFTSPILVNAAIALKPPRWFEVWAVLAAVAASCVLGVLVASKLRPRVVVGVDGLRVVGVLRPIFIPHGEIRDARIVDNAGYLSLFIHAGARTHLLPLIGQSGAEAHALARRIDEGRRRHQGAAGTRDLSLLDRAGMSFEAWRESLRRASLASGGFRAAALDARDFEEVLGDPAASIERRVGAALALREGGAEALDKIRIAASTSAEPRIRIALEAVATEEIDEGAVETVLRMRKT